MSLFLSHYKKMLVLSRPVVDATGSVPCHVLVCGRPQLATLGCCKLPVKQQQPNQSESPGKPAVPTCFVNFVSLVHWC